MDVFQKEAAAFLGTYRAAAAQARAAASDYADACGAALAMSAAAGEGGHGSFSADKMEEAAIDMMEHADAALAAAARLTEMRDLRDEVILAVAARSPLLGEVLQMIYADGMRAAEASRELAAARGHAYAQSSVYKLRDRALSIAWEEMRERGVASGRRLAG